MVKDDGIVTDHAIFRKMVLGLGNKTKIYSRRFWYPPKVRLGVLGSDPFNLKKKKFIGFGLGNKNPNSRGFWRPQQPEIFASPRSS